MYYIALRFEAQDKFMEAMNLLDQYGITMHDFGKMPNGEDKEVPKSVRKIQRNLKRHKGMSVKLGVKTAKGGLTPRETQVYEVASKVLRADSTGVIKRSLLSKLTAEELDLDKGILGPQYTALIRKGYLAEVR